MNRNRAALKACAALIAAGFLATSCGATTDTTGTAAAQTTVTTTVTTSPTAAPSQPVGLVSIPPTKKPVTKATVKPSLKKPVAKVTTKPKLKLTTKPSTKPKPKPSTKPSTKPKPTTEPKPDVYYANCSEVRADGAAPIRRGEPGYSSKLDRDGDGIACEN